MIALRFKHLAESVNPEIVGNVRAFIFDDSTLPKSGIKTEFVSRVHDHVSGDFIFGYKIMVMGYWDGLSFYPLDFTLHREKGGQINNTRFMYIQSLLGGLISVLTPGVFLMTLFLIIGLSKINLTKDNRTYIISTFCALIVIFYMIIGVLLNDTTSIDLNSLSSSLTVTIIGLFVE